VDSEPLPKLTGWLEVVEFRGVPMRIVRTEGGRTDETLCMTCGTHQHRSEVTLRLVDAASYQAETRDRWNAATMPPPGGDGGQADA
jgi:hypothetical protein